MSETVVLFHGTNAVRSMIDAGSWVTDDFEAALAFAQAKADEEGGLPCVATIEVDEADVEWDVPSAMGGVDDERGKLLRPVVVTEWKLSWEDRGLTP